MSQKGVIVYSTQTINTNNNSMNDNKSEQRLSSSPMSNKDNSLYYPWLWSDSAQSIQLSPLPSVWRSSSSPNDFECGSSSAKRGRPRLEEITGLILSGSTSPSAIKCEVCNRVFPREKSLQAHMRTHTGERPYKCEFSDCGRAFAQSGQLRTHQRLHTGEKPFICAQNDCVNRFTHANRRCTAHPRAGVRRISGFGQSDEQNDSVNKILKVNQNIANTNNNNKNSVNKKKLIEKRKDMRRSVITHSGRAARKLHKELDAEADEEDLQNYVSNNNSEHREKIMGALALMQLAGISQNIDIGSEVSIDDNELHEQTNHSTIWPNI